MNIAELKELLQKGATIERGIGVIVRLPDGTGWTAIIAADGEEIKSVPPSGHFKVTNLYVDSATGKLVVEYDNKPAP